MMFSRNKFIYIKKKSIPPLSTISYKIIIICGILTLFWRLVKLREFTTKKIKNPKLKKGGEILILSYLYIS